MNSQDLNQKGPFRSRSCLILGVAAGLADHFGVSRLLLRAVLVAISVLLAFWPVIIMYLIAALILPLEPGRLRV